MASVHMMATQNDRHSLRTQPNIGNVILLIACVVLAGCSFDRNFLSVSPGMARDRVRAILRDPGAARKLTMPAGPFWGPQEALSGILPAGARFEEWQYSSRGTVFYVWFADTNGLAEDRWTVVGKTSHPEGAVF